jgi:hypothetical protein
VIVDGLDCAAYEKYHSLACCHACDFVCNAGSEGIEEETFEGVVVEGTVGVGDIETVVPGMECR